MNLRTIHARELAAPAADAGALLDLLGGPEDRLWPNDTWPASALRLEHPLRVGSRGGHGAIRYRVADYEPGRRIVFAFEPESGVSGRHETRVDALGPARCRLVQTTECRLAAKLLPLYPVLRRQHDALLRDVLDRAELELTGAVAAPARWSRTVRAANVVEEALARRRGALPRITPSRPLPRAARVAGVGAPAAIGGVAVVHAAWAAGWHWPGGSEEALAQRVLSSGSTEMPPDWLTWLVAGVFAGSAAAVSATAVGAGGRRARRATWATAGVFAVRGVLGPIQDAFTGLGTYERLDLAIYSPLCLAIAAGAAAVAWRAGGRTTPTGTPRGNREPAPRPPTANAVRCPRRERTTRRVASAA
jgi:hypothetical protein